MSVSFESIPNLAPKPFYSSSNTFYDFFIQLFSNKKKCPIGFMPCETPYIPYAQTSPFEITITHSKDSDDSSSLSSDDSSIDTIDSEDIVPIPLEETATRSSALLSDILCEHYVYTKIKNSSHEIPLETFSLFETPSSIEDSFVKTTLKLQQQERKPVKIKQEAPLFVRETRSNSNYLRMIVAEVNMMRSQKITGPLKQRRVLPKRLDIFTPKSSPLSQNLVE